VLLAHLAATSAAVAATASRSKKAALLADCLREAAPDEVAIAAAYLSGDLLQRRTGVGWASLRDVPPPAAEPSLTVAAAAETFATIAAVSGTGSQARRRELLAAMLRAATAEEQRFLASLVAGELRQGALASLVTDAVAQAAGLPADDVRRAVMLRGELGPVASAALSAGASGLAGFRLEVGRPVQPMLAQTAESVPAALARLGEAAVEWKIDGVRVQIHRWGSTPAQVRVFTRTLDDITDRVPELVQAALTLPVETVVLDGEAIALRDGGPPRPFQETASRVGSRVDVEKARLHSPLTLFVFDALHVDGEELLDRPARERNDVLGSVVPASLLVPRILTSDPAVASAFLADAIERGHEGVVVKSLDAVYAAGRRGTGWLKVKPVHTLDLVVLAVEWGHGRRRGWLSNLHLGARDPATGGFVMLGKTFKGLTDAMLREQTKWLLALEESRNEWQVFVRPELVVEIAFDGVQTSPRYPGGVALRFARVVRYRPDKSAAEADTIDDVLAIHARQS
jgi:DNA ligase 1